LWMSPKFYKSARVEVHGTYTVHGNGATVQYLGLGQTIILGTGSGAAAVPTPWGSDPGFSPSYPATTMFTIAIATTKGDTSITLGSAAGVTVGMYLFVAGNPTASSSPNNYIPSDFEFVQVTSIAGNVVTLDQPLQSAYLTTQSGVFYTPGLALHCTVNDLNVLTTAEAYQTVVRSSFACTLNNILYTGINSPGAATFSDNLVYNNITIENSGAGGLSTGRGIVSATFNNIHLNSYSIAGGISAFFIEESFYKVTINNFLGTGIIAGGSCAIVGGQRPRKLSINDSIINSAAYGGLYGAFTFGTFQGVDVTVSNCTFKGAVVTPNAGNYPSITGDAMVWMSGNLATDVITFQNCKFISANAGNTWPSAIGGFLGTVRFDALCEFITSTAPSQVVPISAKGLWIPTVFGATTAGSTTYTQQSGSYSREGNMVTVTFVILWSGTTATGDVKIGNLPFTASADNFGITPVFTGTTLIADGILFAVEPSAVTAYGYLPISSPAGSLYGKLTYII
jgi:hypothetical protein